MYLVAGVGAPRFRSQKRVRPPVDSCLTFSLPIGSSPARFIGVLALVLFLDCHEQPAGGVLEVFVGSVAGQPREDVVHGVAHVHAGLDAAPILHSDELRSLLVLRLAAVEDPPDPEHGGRDDVER